MTLRAVLWDMDGLLVDTEPLWTIPEEELARSHGGVWTDDIKAAVVGTRLDVAVPTILRHYRRDPVPREVERTSAWLLHRMVELFSEGVTVLPGVIDLLAALRTEQIPVALVSSSYRVLVDAVVATGLGPFDLLLAGDEVGRGKPDPEPYLTAARGLGVDPALCVVLEDSPAGVSSGLAAGCAVLAVPSVPGVRFSPGPRLAVVDDLRGVGSDQLRRLVAGPS